MELRIDPEFESSIPPISDDEFSRLEENILADGVIISPIIVWDGVIIDGHNRFRIAGKHPDIGFTTCEHDFKDRNEAMAWICKNQLGRRNLTFQQKRYLIGKQFSSEKQRQGTNNQHIQAKSEKCQVGTFQNSEDTAERIAKENGIGRRSVYRAEEFAKAVDIADDTEPGIRSEILAGRIKPTQREVQALTKASPEERPAIVEDLRKPPQEKQGVLPARNLLTLEQIASELPDENSRVSPESMLYELEDALDTFTFRWSVALSHNKDYFSAEEHRTKINRLAEDGLDYLNQILKGEIPL